MCTPFNQEESIKSKNQLEKIKTKNIYEINFTIDCGKSEKWLNFAEIFYDSYRLHLTRHDWNNWSNLLCDWIKKNKIFAIFKLVVEYPFCLHFLETHLKNSGADKDFINKLVWLQKKSFQNCFKNRTSLWKNKSLWQI